MLWNRYKMETPQSQLATHDSQHRNRAAKQNICLLYLGFVYCSIHGYKKVNNGPIERERERELALDNNFFLFYCLDEL